MADDNLEYMLLAAAGRSKGSGNNNNSSSNNRHSDGKRRPMSSSTAKRGSSSSSDEDEDDEDDYEDKSGAGGPGGAGAGPGGSKMPLKKRFDSGDKDDGYASDLSFGSDLYKDEEDRKKLEAMTELQRELILCDRSERRDNYKLKKQTDAILAAEQQKQRDRHDGPPSSRMRSSGRETSKSVKAHALNELVAKRQKAQDTDQQRKRRDIAAAAAAAAAASSRRSASPSSNSDADSEEEEESSRESNRSEGLPSEDEDDERGGREMVIDNEDIRKITIRRSKLFKWFMEPFFEEVIVGCFVRIGIGMSNSGSSIYRLCMVKNVDAKDPDKQYKFENRMTYKYLNCTWGDESTAARWQMVRASDQPPTDAEINAWKAEVAKSGGSGLTKSSLKEKLEALEKVGTYVYSAAAVKQMLQEKKMAAARPSNVVLEKERLMKDLSVAEAKGDQEQIERLQDRLKELESLASKQQSKNEKAERIEMMNRRNRFENFKNASELKPVNSAAKMGEAGYDPFSRRWTRSQNYYKSDAPKTAAEQNEANLAEKAAKELATLDESSKQANARLAGNQHHSKMFNLHDFDLPISLSAIERFKGGQGAFLAFMERKRKMEARYGVRVESNDGRRHSLTLTVNDYKRRRGLL